MPHNNLINISETILNRALSLAMEFGENWLMPVQERLIGEYPHIESPMADQIDLLCKEVMSTCNSATGKELKGRNETKIEIREVNYRIRRILREKYIWISEENLNRLFSQACYYAYKDGWQG